MKIIIKMIGCRFSEKNLMQRRNILRQDYISADLDIMKPYLNGNKIGDHVLDPGFTTYRKQALYTVYDITALIKKGKNAAGLCWAVAGTIHFRCGYLDVSICENISKQDGPV